MKNKSSSATQHVAIIGAGPAGLSAAEMLSQHNVRVTVYDAMPSIARKFLYAGKSGLNLTHAEPKEIFDSRYGDQVAHLKPFLAAFSPENIRSWADALGAETFVGSSGHVFPKVMKAAPLLKAWTERLTSAGVQFCTSHRWTGWSQENALQFDTKQGSKTVQADAVILALGGKSWAKLGANGLWSDLLSSKNIAVNKFKPSNCGFNVDWSEFLKTKYAGRPIKSVEIRFKIKDSILFRRRGEFVITENGVEGSLIYAASAMIRDEIEKLGAAKTIYLDLLPDYPVTKIVKKLSKSRGSDSLSNFLRKQFRLQGAKIGLIHEFIPSDRHHNPALLAESLKAVPVPLIEPRPIDEAISTAGGVSFDALNNDLMLTQMPGVFCAGEMIDWEAPTGGYLLTACFATGRAAGKGVLNWLKNTL